MSREIANRTGRCPSGDGYPEPGRPSGFSMVDVMVALTLAALVVLGTSEMISYGVAVNKGSSDLTEVTTLAADRIEELRSRPYDEIEVGGSIEANAPGFFDEPDTDADGSADFTRRWEVTDLDGRKQIRIRVISPLNADGRARETTLVTLVADRQLGSTGAPADPCDEDCDDDEAPPGRGRGRGRGRR